MAQDVKEERLLSEERRAALTVLRIANRLNSKNRNGPLLSDNLYKQGEHYNQSVSARIVILTKHDLKWFHSEEEVATDKYLGRVNL